MTRYSSLDQVRTCNAWLTIGVFDGVHRGHQEILGRMVAGAHAAGSPAVVLTFSPHPAVALGGQTDFKCLTTPDERAGLLESLGVDVVITQTFDRAFADQTAEDFMRRTVRSLRLTRLLIGYDTALGRGREGDASRLAMIGKTLGYSVETIPVLKDASGVISSTRIRSEVVAGNIAAAQAGLGRFHFVTGPVVHGDGRGRTINVPTANLQIPEGKLIPGNGIYATWAWLDGKKIPAATNVGLRPTFTPNPPEPTVEAYLLDFSQDLYGREIKLEFVEFLRPEEKYATVAALVEQIQIDIRHTREKLKV